ncbi:MAG TPA: hypothetical protein VJ625_11600 [Propionibacteriaceae bacterium]|nr:hypothetical protein [Propionibacteriaceae bacterium]
MAGGVLENLDKLESADRLSLALQLEGIGRPDMHRVTHQPMRSLGQQDLPGCRGLFKPGRDVDSVAYDELWPNARVRSHDLARVHTDTDRQPHTVALLELGVELAERISHVTSRSNRAQRVVLVESRNAEHGHDRIANELFDGAAVTFDHAGHLVEVAAHHPS